MSEKEILAQLNLLEQKHGPSEEIASIRRDLARLDPDRPVLVSMSYADARIGAGQLRLIVEIHSKSLPDDTKRLLKRLAEAMEAVR